MRSGLRKLLESQLGGHLRVHMDSRETSPVRVTHSQKAPKKSRSSLSNVFYATAELQVYTISCGAASRGGIRDYRSAGTVVLLQSASGQDFCVELSTSSKKVAVTRVSTGATARDLRRAVLRASTALPHRKFRRELRILRLNAMHLSTIWLHRPKDSNADIFVPYTPAFAGLKLGRTYNLQRFESLLKKCASEMILRWYWRHENELAQTA